MRGGEGGRVLRLSAVGIFRPLAIRDFALLWTGLTVSLLGNGIYLVALAWQVYDLSNTPTALALVGAAWFGPQVAFLLVGGVVSDRFERRHVMIFADVTRAAAIAAIGLLSLTGALELWHVLVLIAIYGVGDALFVPAFSAIVPDVVPASLLVEANSLRQFVGPLTARLVGPALGGWLVAWLGAGEAFLIDAVTFLVSAGAILTMQTRSLLEAWERSARSIVRDIREGLAFVRGETWLWGTFLAVTFAMLFFLGPVFVLMPFVVKNELGAGAGGLGLVFAAGGVGAIVASLVMGQRGLSRRPMSLMYAAWALSGFSLVGYALSTELWQAIAVSFISVGALTVGQIVWSTLLQRLVPGALLGRVSSFDSFVSFALVPVSYALTGPVADLCGASETLVYAGVLSGAVLLGVLLLVPGVRVAGPGERRLREADGVSGGGGG